MHLLAAYESMSCWSKQITGTRPESVWARIIKGISEGAGHWRHRSPPRVPSTSCFHLYPITLLISQHGLWSLFTLQSSPGDHPPPGPRLSCIYETASIVPGTNRCSIFIQQITEKDGERPKEMKKVGKAGWEISNIPAPLASECDGWLTCRLDSIPVHPHIWCLFLGASVKMFQMKAVSSPQSE